MGIASLHPSYELKNESQNLPRFLWQAWAIAGLCGRRTGSGRQYKKRSSRRPRRTTFSCVELAGEPFKRREKCFGQAPVRLRITKPAYLVQISWCWGFEGPAPKPKPIK